MKHFIVTYYKDGKLITTVNYESTSYESMFEILKRVARNTAYTHCTIYIKEKIADISMSPHKLDVVPALPSHK